ncbi:MAG TPA: hypothetical protein VLL04_01160, partial [Rhizomicrobium sp.]|nr:hypothetical protein [Rhizomicrobium sp.]
GLVQRAFEFQMTFAQMRHLAGKTALVAAAGTTATNKTPIRESEIGRPRTTGAFFFDRSV